MKQATIRSVCECQSQLEAVLDEHRFVLAGFAIGPDRLRERAPAHSIEAQHKRFDVAWMCPICGRNTLRSFDGEALAWIDAAPPAPGATPPVAPPAPPGPGPATGLSSPPLTAASPSRPPMPSRPGLGSAPPPKPSTPSTSTATAVALKSLTSTSRPPPARPPSNPPPPAPATSNGDPPKTS